MPPSSKPSIWRLKPAIAMTSAIVSRCRVFQFYPLTNEDVETAVLAAVADEERGFGKLEGQAWDAAGRHGPDQPDDTVDIDYAVEGGESLRQFQTRVLSCFEALAQDNTGKNLLVFAHGGVIDMVWRKLNQQALNAKRTHAILNTSLNFFNIDKDLNWTCTQWGQLPHLNTALDEQL